MYIAIININDSQIEEAMSEMRKYRKIDSFQNFGLVKM